jgi:hypothetical protein
VARLRGDKLGILLLLMALSLACMVLAAPLMALVSHLPPADWRIGTPMFFCAALQILALVLAVLHFRRQARRSPQLSPRATPQRQRWKPSWPSGRPNTPKPATPSCAPATSSSACCRRRRRRRASSPSPCSTGCAMERG